MNTEQITGQDLRALQTLAEREGLPHPDAPGVTWQLLQNLASVSKQGLRHETMGD